MRPFSCAVTCAADGLNLKVTVTFATYFAQFLHALRSMRYAAQSLWDVPEAHVHKLRLRVHHVELVRLLLQSLDQVAASPDIASQRQSETQAAKRVYSLAHVEQMVDVLLQTRVTLRIEQNVNV